MQYMLMIYGNEQAMGAATPEQINQTLSAYMDYTKALRESGALVAGDRLKPSTAATTVRMVDGRTKVQDGPYAEAKEQLGGYYIIEAPDLDAALNWAGRCPGARYGVIEVRPIWSM
jgi:hypothetical protein